ncbi:MAG: hypothetical protein WC152_01285 [Candidatus Izemoplasmatales bacterium]
MRNKNLDFIAKVVFFGALWGIVEATLGYALHLLPALIAGSIMFPLVMFILYHAYKSLGSRTAIFYVAIIAIMIKATNLFLPMLYPAKTINPMIAMFIQSLLAFLVIPMLSSEKPLMKLSAVALVSVGWRVVMVGYYGLNYLTTGFLDFRIASINPLISYVVYEGLISTLLAVGLLYLTSPVNFLSRLNKTRINPVVSAALLAIAIILTLVKF